jgi:hypothetical protein
LATAEIEIQNLRNKYQDSTVIKPLIDYCDGRGISFEFLKETLPLKDCVKRFNKRSTYYMKIGENMFTQEEDKSRWNDLFKIIIEAYDYLRIERPPKLLSAYGATKRN